jgi:DHA2 family multidrug resistance protein-like MFS transporter
MTKPFIPALDRPLARRVRTASEFSALSAKQQTPQPMSGIETHSAPQPPEATGLPELRRTVAIASVLSAMALVVLDAAIANVALPAIAGSLYVTPAMSVLIITAYQTALVIGLLPCAALGESLGYRRVFTIGVALFTGASVACAMAPFLPWLIAARFVQGLGGAAVMALGVALMRFVVPYGRLGAAIGWNALTVALSSAAGPTIGSAILSVANWPWLWLVAGAELLPAAPVLAITLLIAAALGLAALVRREIPKEVPLIPLDLLRARSFRVSAVASVCCFIGQTAGLVALPFYLQHGLGQSPMMIGLYITPWPLTVAIAAPIVGRLANRVSTAWLCATGGACLATGLAAASLWPLQGDPRPLMLFTALCGVGFGLFNVPNNRNRFLSAPPERSGAAGGMQGTARLVGQTTGAVVMTLLFTLIPFDAAPRIGLGIGAALTLAAGLVSTLRVRPVARASPEV